MNIDHSGDNIINIGSGSNISVNEIADMLSKTAPRINNPPVVEPRETLADIKIATNFLNWEPTVKLSDWIENYKNILGI